MTSEEDRMLFRHMIRDHGLTEEDLARIARNYDQDEEDESYHHADHSYVQDYKKSGDSRKLWTWIVGSSLHSGNGGLGAGSGGVTGCESLNPTDST